MKVFDLKEVTMPEIISFRDAQNPKKNWSLKFTLLGREYLFFQAAFTFPKEILPASGLIFTLKLFQLFIEIFF